MKTFGLSVFLGVLFALPIIYILDSDPDRPLSTGAIAFILFFTIGALQLIASLFFKKGDK